MPKKFDLETLTVQHYLHGATATHKSTLVVQSSHDGKQHITEQFWPSNGHRSGSMADANHASTVGYLRARCMSQHHQWDLQAQLTKHCNVLQSAMILH